MIQNGYTNRNTPATVIQRAAIITPPPGMLPKPTIAFPPPIINPSESSIKSFTESTKTASLSSRSMSTVSHQSDYEVTDNIAQSVKKPTAAVASFPPRQNPSVFNTTPATNGKSLPTPKNDFMNGHYSSSLLNQAIKNDHTNLQSKVNVNNKIDIPTIQRRDTPSSVSSHDSLTRSNTKTTPQITSSILPSHSNTDDDSANRPLYQTSRISASTE